MRSLLVALVALGLVGPVAPAQDCDPGSDGLPPLDDLGTGFWLGEQGGLYPDGQNVRPAAHDAAGRALALEVVPRDEAGSPSSLGKIGFAAIGMSFTKAFWEEFESRITGAADVAPSLSLVDLTQPGQAAEDLADPDAPYWDNIPGLLDDAGVTAEQVQVIWMLEGNFPTDLPFPDHARLLEEQFVVIVGILHDLFPNLKIVFVTPLEYLGYAPGGRHEPESGEQGFSVRWLIERQIEGDPALNWDPALGPVVAPWLSWGPYLWADGLLPRSDGLAWACADYLMDGRHPTASGKRKGAILLEHHFRSDPVATPWFLVAGGGRCGHPADVELYGAGTTGTAGVPLIAVSEVLTIPTAAPIELITGSARPAALGLFILGTEAIPLGDVPFAGGWLLAEPRWFFPVVTDPAGFGSASLAAVPDDPQLCDLVVYAQLAMVDPLGPTGTYALSRGIEIVLGD